MYSTHGGCKGPWRRSSCIGWWYVCSYSCWIVKGLRCSVILFKFEKSPTITNVRNFESTGGYDQMFPTYFVHFLIWHFNFASLAHLVFPSPSGRLLEHNKYPVSVAIYPLDAWLKEVPPVTMGWEASGSAPPIAAEEIAWFELLHWVAKPASNQSSVPQHFRAVLFMVPWMEIFLESLGEGASIVDVADGKKPVSIISQKWFSFLNLCFFIPIFLWCQAKRRWSENSSLSFFPQSSTTKLRWWSNFLWTKMNRKGRFSCAAPKFNMAPENRSSQKNRNVFKPSFWRGASCSTSGGGGCTSRTDPSFSHGVSSIQDVFCDAEDPITGETLTGGPADPAELLAKVEAPLAVVGMGSRSDFFPPETEAKKDGGTQGPYQKERILSCPSNHQFFRVASC